MQFVDTILLYKLEMVYKIIADCFVGKLPTNNRYCDIYHKPFYDEVIIQKV
jgi:hypothetical protein